MQPGYNIGNVAHIEVSYKQHLPSGFPEPRYNQIPEHKRLRVYARYVFNRLTDYYSGG